MPIRQTAMIAIFFHGAKYSMGRAPLAYFTGSDRESTAWMVER